MTRPQKTEHEIHRIIRRESAQLKAALVAHLGPDQLALAEDVAQEAILTALKNWQQQDVPDKPGAWLKRVARNRAIDVLRRRARETPIDLADEPVMPISEPGFLNPEDAELRMLYLSCHPAISPQDQAILCLNLVAGFTAGQISRLLIKPRQTIAQRLVRLKKKLRQQHDLTELHADAIPHRNASVLRALYLMFCAGYLPPDGDQLFLADVVGEALRLAELVAERGDPNASALCALFCLQSSRFEAREKEGMFIPLSQQDRSLWDQALLQRALYHLKRSQNTHTIGRYHIEAAIALEHANAVDFNSTDWSHIAALYQQLERMTESPIVTVSAALANLYMGEPTRALAQLERVEKIPSMTRYPAFFAALAEVCMATGDLDKADAAQKRARQLQANDVLKTYLDERYASLLQDI
ncbi:MAG: RNA polymerase sigma factor [bacterium]